MNTAAMVAAVCPPHPEPRDFFREGDRPGIRCRRCGEQTFESDFPEALIVKNETPRLDANSPEPSVASVRAAAVKAIREGFAPVPIPRGSKNPGFEGWQTTRLTEADVPARVADDGNLGIILGAPSKNLHDVDLDCPEALRLADDFLPVTTREHGRKSTPRAHRWYIPDEPGAVVRYKDPEGEKDTLVELRGEGGQSVIPPSTHPSRESLTWEKDGEPAAVSLSVLRSAVSRLAAACILARRYPKKDRHDFTNALAGFLLRRAMPAPDVEALLLAVARSIPGAARPEDVRHIKGNVRDTEKRIRAGKPATGGKALSDVLSPKTLDKITEWLGLDGRGNPLDLEVPEPSSDVPTDDGEGTSDEKAESAAPESRDGAAKRLIQLGQTNTLLFHDERETPHAAIGTDDARRIVAVKSETFTTFLSGAFYRATGRAANSEALTSARRVLSHKAVFEGAKHTLHNRFAFRDGAAWIDLANEKQEAVKVTAEGWTVERPPILFRRFRRQAALPKPATSGNMKKLSGFLNTREDEDALLALVWPVAAMLGNVPRPVLDFHGPQGSAKTTAAKILRRLTDPSVAPTSYLSQKDDELALCLESNAVPLFDNVTHISARQGEILCAAVTGAGFSKRELFTDSDEILYSYQRAIIVTGINVATVAPDLLDRFLLLQLDRLDRTARRSEAALWRAFEAVAPTIFSGMLDALSSAMKLYSGIAEKTTRLERMADFCLWGASVSESLGFGADAFFKAYNANVSAQTEEVLEADPVARAVRELLAKCRKWTGTASELLKLFRDTHGDETKTDGWPKRADGLSRRIRVIEATLAEVGISVKWSREGEARTRTLTVEKTAEHKPNSSSFASGGSVNGAQTDATDAEKGYSSARHEEPAEEPVRRVVP